ncbi:hypothetical protein CTM97_15930 [Photobacterium phosphoreum]|uniref:Uncharacterized protein n=1 Tax=Photobacterium phosphoreum TaxID=659 RepID=A0A2T3JT64_PHOPO|nr:hypothetical protein [Photobacterium phosphoreum]PSU21993.1 hypothetical protein CTM96_16740 [Photobacterium phosphoreum]PSU40494.1 hypothetical protein CTM97_15930 [Photobacterium phosphoreum]PSU52361.1 hypothetical protein C9J18_09460 [Photobacterium phosphoreum]
MFNINTSPVPSQENIIFHSLFVSPFDNVNGHFVGVQTHKYGSLSLDNCFDMQINNSELVIKQSGCADWIFTGDQKIAQKLKDTYMPFSRQGETSM